MRLLIILLVLMALLSPQSAFAVGGWNLYAEVDEMTGTEEMFALYEATVDSGSVEVVAKCEIEMGLNYLWNSELQGKLPLDITTFDTHLATSLANTAQGRVVMSQTRLDRGDGNVETAMFELSREFSNLYSAFLWVNSIDGYRLKIELVFEDGSKHIVRGDEMLGAFVEKCKNEYQAKMQPIEQAKAEEAAQREAQEAERLAREEQEQAALKELVEAAFSVDFISTEDEINKAWDDCLTIGGLFGSLDGNFEAKFLLGPDGRPSDVTITRSSGSRKLDKRGVCILEGLRFGRTSCLTFDYSEGQMKKIFECKDDSLNDVPVVQQFGIRESGFYDGAKIFHIYDHDRYWPRELRETCSAFSPQDGVRCID